MTALKLLGSTIRTKRKERNFTIVLLATKTGLNRSYISEVERGKRNVSALNLFKIAEALECELTELVRPLDYYLGLSSPSPTDSSCLL